MAEAFHFSIPMINREKSRSAVADTVYISCEKLTNEWDGVAYDYHNKKGLLHSEIFLPENVPIALKDRTTSWNSVELNEKASNVQFARNFIIALPKELPFEENTKLIIDLIQENFTSRGMIADLAIHDGSDEENNNIHARIMATLRPISEKGRWQTKSRKEYVLDKNGEKIKLKGGNYKTRKAELTDWSDKDNIEKWRENFTSLCNQYLERNHQEKRVDHRPHKRQGIEKIPTIHIGTSVNALEKKGIETNKGNINRGVEKHNSLAKAIKEKLLEINSRLNSLVSTFQAKYNEYRKTRQQEIENKAELLNLYEYTSIYNEIQGKKIKDLSYYGRIKKGSADLKRFVKVVYYLKNNYPRTIANLQGKVFELAK